MWNRVLLLAFGMATGWSLVNYWAAPADQARSRAIQFGLSVALGLGVIAWLAMGAAESGIAGALVFAFCTVVAYAAHARRVDRIPTDFPFPKPADPLVRDHRRAVILVADLEPETYDGPSFWARRFHQAAKRGASTPHWLARPRIYAHIRAAYQQMGNHYPAWSTLDGMSRELEQRLGADYRVRVASLYATPTLAEALVEWADVGVTRFVVASIDAEVASEALDEQVVRSRVRELGVEARFLIPSPAISWSASRLDGRLARLASRQMVDASFAPQQLVQLCDEVARF